MKKKNAPGSSDESGAFLLRGVTDAAAGGGLVLVRRGSADAEVAAREVGIGFTVDAARWEAAMREAVPFTRTREWKAGAAVREAGIREAHRSLDRAVAGAEGLGADGRATEASAAVGVARAAGSDVRLG